VYLIPEDKKRGFDSLLIMCGCKTVLCKAKTQNIFDLPNINM